MFIEKKEYLFKVFFFSLEYNQPYDSLTEEKYNDIVEKKFIHFVVGSDYFGIFRLCC